MKVEVDVPGLPVSNNPYIFCGRKANITTTTTTTTTTTEVFHFRGQELCESRGGRPGLPVPDSP